MSELVLLIDKVAYPIGAQVKNSKGEIGVITGFSAGHFDDRRPLKCDFLNYRCGHYGPNAEDAAHRVTLVNTVGYPEKPETLRRPGPEWGDLGDLADEHNIIIEDEANLEAQEGAGR